MTDRVEAAARAIWDSLCPGIRQTDEDRRFYERIANGALAAADATQSAELERLRADLDAFAAEAALKAHNAAVEKCRQIAQECADTKWGDDACELFADGYSNAALNILDEIAALTREPKP